jgi:hypothetical protein
MGIDPITAGLGLGGLLMQNEQNRKSNNAQKDARKGQDALMQRQIDLFDMLQRVVTDADKGGQFDPERQIAQLDKDVAKNQGRDMGNLGAGMSAAGYRPGDSEIGTRMDSVGLKYRDYRNRTANDIRTNSFLRKLQAYQGIGGQQLNPALSVYGQREHDAMGSMGNPSNFFSSIMPFLNKPQQQGQQGGGFDLAKYDWSKSKFF